MKLHQKAFLLVTLSRTKEGAWDHDLITHAMHEYSLCGRLWINTLRSTLDELASGGLVERIEARLDDGGWLEPGKVLFCYRLTDFGRQRMRDTGLLQCKEM